MALTSKTKRTIIYIIVICTICFSVIFSSIEKVTELNTFEITSLTGNSFNKIKSLTYEPEEFIEIKKDTILSNGFNVSVKNYAVMDNSDAFLLNSDESLYRRPFNAAIDVQFSNQTVFTTLIDNSYLSKLYNNELVYLEHAWLDDEATEQDSITIALSCIEPNSNRRLNLYLKINNLGQLFDVTSDRKTS